MKYYLTKPSVPIFDTERAGEIVDEGLYGESVELLGGGERLRILTGCGYEGCVRRSDLAPPPETARGRRGVIHFAFADILEKPSLQSRRIITLPRGAEVFMGQPRGMWREVFLPDRNGESGFVHIRAVHAAPGKPRAVTDGLRSRIAAAAAAYLGAPYRWGGRTPGGIDCSGLCYMAYRLCGLNIWRDAEAREGLDLRFIGMDAARRGDIIYFRPPSGGRHCAVYLGDGRIIHANASDGIVTAVPLRSRPDLVSSIVAVGTALQTNAQS